MLKRIFDIIFSLLVLFWCSPVFIISAFLIKIDSKGTIFFKQKRIGKKGKPFTILKFRTMKDLKGPLLTSLADTRITKAGKFLRRTNFDELPQFINIFKGELSVVGPRPEIPEIVRLYTKEQKKILSFMPGFTSFATVKFLNENKIIGQSNIMEFYAERILPQKIKYDLDYFRNSSNIFRDIVIILRTIGGTFNV